MRLTRLPSLLLPALVAAAGCVRTSAPSFTDPGVVWVDRDVPRTFDLAPYVAGGEGTASAQSQPALAVAATGLRLTLSPAADFTGEVALPVTIRHGGARTVSLHVRVKDGSADCMTTFRWHGQATHVAVAGSFNGFSTTANPMSDPDGVGDWRATLALPPGDWAYKLVVDGNWELDPVDPLTMFAGGVENSREVVADCAQPRLDVFDVAVGTTTGTFAAHFVFVDGSAGDAVAAPPAVTLDGAAPDTAPGWDGATKVLSLSLAGLAPGKHAIDVTAADVAGRVAPPRHVPFWIDAGKTFDWRDAVMYFAFTDRFRDGDATNDAPESGVPAQSNWQGGDWKGIHDAIDEGYFDDLGVNALWVSPVNDQPSGGWVGSDGRQYVGYHGYWPAGPRAPEEHFGDLAALGSMVGAAHAHGMRVLLDVVLNHVHQASPYWTDHGGAPWFNPLYVCGFDQPLTCWFASYLPDFDYTDLEPVKAQIADAKWWIEQSGADGFRVDAVKHFQPLVGRALRDALNRDYDVGGSHFYLVGETYVGRWADAGQAALVKQYVSPDQYDGQFDFPLYWQILSNVGRHEGTLYDLEQMLRESQGYYGASATMGTFLGNHDVPRFISHANGDIADLFGSNPDAKEQGWTSPPAQPTAHEPYARLRQAFTLLLALPGLPTIYYGDEIGLAGAGDPDNRRMMTWTGWSAEQQQTHDLVAKLAHLRRAHHELSRGTYQQVWREADLLVLERADGASRAYVGLNRGATDRTVSAAVTAPDGATFTDAVNGAHATVSHGTLPITVPASGSCLYVSP